MEAAEKNNLEETQEKAEGGKREADRKLEPVSSLKQCTLPQPAHI